MSNKKSGRMTDLVFGRHAAGAALEINVNRIEKIWIQNGTHLPGKISQAVRDAEKMGAVVQYLDRQSLDRLTDGNTHQGIALRTAEVAFHELDTWLKKHQNGSLLLMVLDGIQDPGNLGAIFRTAAAAGVNAIVVPRREMAPIGGTAMKTSAGTLNATPVIRVSNIRNALITLKNKGFFITGISEKSSSQVMDMPDFDKHALLFGSEDRGIRAINVKECDEIRSIPMTGPAGSLNVSAAVAVVLYEIVRSKHLRADKKEKKLDFQIIQHRLPDAD